MDSRELTRTMTSERSTANIFKGVFPADYFIDVEPNYPAAYIINTDSHEKPGKHWVALYLTSNGHCEFFDFYGHPPQYYHHAWLDWIKYYSYKWTYNQKHIQPTYSATCGVHCLFYIYHWCQGMTLKTIQSLFSNNLPLNDVIAEEDLESHVLEDIIIDDSTFFINQLCSSLIE